MPEHCEKAIPKLPMEQQMTSTDALERALGLISHSGWCQKAGARDVHGRGIGAGHELAVQFSLDGALQRVTWPDGAKYEEPDPEEPVLTAALNEAMWKLAKLAGMNGEANAWGSIAKWNDSPMRTKEQVVHLLRCAIASDDGDR